MAQHTTAEKTVNTAFLRLANRHISASLRRFSAPSADESCGFSSLGDLALYAMIGTVLSNPAFTYANGGLQNLLLRHTKNRYFSLHSAIRRLSAAGYLLRTRIPEGKNCFRDYYTLSHNKDTAEGVSGAPSCCLTAAEGRKFRAAHRPFQPPTEDYTEVSIPMLMDPTLSLGAKGLYIVIARYLRLQKYKPEIVLSKDMLRRVCREGANAFDRMFRELRCRGYLILTRTTSAETGYPSYRYSLNQEADTRDVSLCRAQKATEVHPSDAHVLTDVSANEDRTAAAVTTPTTAPTQNEIRDQIDYDCLIDEYPKERLDCIVSILHTYLGPPDSASPNEIHLGKDSCSRKELRDRFSALDSEDIRYVLDTYKDIVKTKKIHHIRRYLTTCLFHAKENLALALDAFALRAPGTV